ncbi:MAG TPA: VWA domain-containing protein [Acidobacteriaceae bacterium]|jgi:VWFA-related protein|nr:VWA domain-containing protein [Acidobacteriaceae bacterium]
MRRFLLILVFICCFAAPLLAQIAPSPDAPPGGGDDTSQGPQLQTGQPVTTFKVTTNLVNLYFVARDKRGALIPTLTKDECVVYEDNVQQTIKNFSAQTDLPLTLGIMLDTSLSQMSVLPMEQQTGDAFLKRVMRPKDEAFLISFDLTVDLMNDFTNNPSEIARAMDKAQIVGNTSNYANGTVPDVGKPKGTVLYDAIYLASNDKLSRESGRKALILLTDGQDEGSQESENSAIESAQKADAINYVLLISDPGAYRMFAYAGESAMHRLADATGGQVFTIGSNGKKMEGAFEEIESELRTQYLVSYTPTNKKVDGTYRKIRVECTQNGQKLRVQARQGYYAIAHDSNQ